MRSISDFFTLRRTFSVSVAALAIPVAACAPPGGTPSSNGATNLSHPVVTSSGEIRTTPGSKDYLFADGGSGALRREKDLPVYYGKISDQERDNVVQVCDDYARVAIVKAAGFSAGLGVGTLFQRGIGGGPGPTTVNTDLDSVRTGCVKKHAPLLA